MSKRFFALAAFAAASLSAQAQVQLTAASLNYSQNFDTLASSGTSSSLPAGWAFLEGGSNANTTYAAGTGSDTAGNTYSFGKAGSTERALGGLRSGSLVPQFGVSFVNLAGRAIESVSIGYIGEQWRLGGTGRTDRLSFQYSTDATTLNSGTWTNLSALDFIAPKNSTPTGALDGNAAANRSALSGSIAGLNLAQGGSLWLRWSDVDVSGSDDGLAIDDFSFNATLAPVPEPSTYALLLAGLCAVGLMSRRRLGR
ncbi:PEP-CTERM sorting domain-containing protein [Kinneretia asaccharophila]|uniref:Putative secreted protein with PEP-CTERM sorting signal n=1 Tax=Roseateles asaccharophilus TaxID=582607 RepID=A0A4R6NFT4_9BURK|nr:PEP-CTERM sorting domain-containing protein [Roseateles asaccharophilus]MDN3543177.1 PEP-CTERM sorting domain-containing protein [Roseateles asaccharophilus]TDP13124.1 putative secreted protein with PEP-CTERM sorting signal [Roseateles asaccharophilus]